MPDLFFAIEGAEAVAYAAAPILSFKLRVRNSNAQERIHTVALRVQVQIEPGRRPYREDEKPPLRDLFGEPDRWSQTLRPLAWINTSILIPQFQDAAAIDLQLPCSFDFNIAATKYFHGVTEGDLPLNFLFSGTVFHESEEAPVRVAPISWDKEARYRLPVETWRRMMEHYYPNSAWLSLRRDVFQRAYRYKVLHGIPTWEEALDRLLNSQLEEEKRETTEVALQR